MMVLGRIATTLSSPLPAGESVGRLWRPFLLKNAEAKLRLWRIVRCAAGEGTFRESELRGETPHPTVFAALRRSTSPLRGEVRNEPLQPEFITPYLPRL